MNLPRFSELTNAMPFNRGTVKTISMFNRHEKPSKYALLKNLRRIVIRLFHCFSGWLQPLLPHSIKETVSAVQDRDPYLESLLMALHGRK